MKIHRFFYVFFLAIALSYYCIMIHYITPYSISGNLFDEIDRYFRFILNANDWIAIMDGDVMFITPDWGHRIEKYTKLFPETGIFTCYASRCSYQFQIPDFVDTTNIDLRYHADIAYQCRSQFGYEVTEINRRIAGHLMVIRKSAWKELRDEIRKNVLRRGKKILGVDTQISKTFIEHRKPIRLMKSIYMVHYFRLKEGNAEKRGLK